LALIVLVFEPRYGNSVFDEVSAFMLLEHRVKMI